MNLDLLATLGIIAAAAVYLFLRLRKKNAGCCGCGGCQTDLAPKPHDCGCSSKKS